MCPLGWRAALAFCSFFGSEFGPLKTDLSHGFIGLGASKTGAGKRACGPGCGRRKGAGKRGKGAGEMRKGCGKGAEGIRKWRGKSRKSAGKARKRSGRSAKERCGKCGRGAQEIWVNAEKDAGGNRRSAREIREKARRNVEKACEGCAALYWAGICFETGFERVDGRERMRAGVPAGLACLPLRFALFSGANLAPLKTALSHGFIGLGASKTGAEKRVCGPGCGRRKGAGNAKKARAKRGKGAERVRKEFGNGGRKKKNSAGKARKKSGRSAKKRCGKCGRGAQEIWVNAEKDAGEA